MNAALLRSAVMPHIRPVVHKITEGQRISAAEAVLLYEKAPLFVLSQLALGIKEKKSGREVYYNRNFHIEPSNICVFRCRFCSFRREIDSADAWSMTPAQVEAFAAGFQHSQVTEVHIVGGVHPDHDLDFYTDMIRRVKRLFPHITVKAYSAVELIHIIEKAGMSYKDGLSLLKEAGMDTIPGGGAEIFDEEIRRQICPEKAGTEKWLELHRQAHLLGLPTNCTMLYGHIESLEHRIHHLQRLRDLQDETGGFNAFIPLKFRSANNELSARGETSVIDDLKTLAIARIFLDNIPHLKAYWPMYGKATTRTALLFGADDVDGTIQDTTKIYSMAGAADAAPHMSVGELQDIICQAGFIPIERDSFYRPAGTHVANQPASGFQP